MELHVAQDQDGDIHITDNHKNLPKNPVRSFLMNFPGKQREVYIQFEVNLKLSSKEVWKIDSNE